MRFLPHTDRTMSEQSPTERAMRRIEELLVIRPALRLELKSELVNDRRLTLALFGALSTVDSPETMPDWSPLIHRIAKSLTKSKPDSKGAMTKASILFGLESLFLREAKSPELWQDLGEGLHLNLGGLPEPGPKHAALQAKVGCFLSVKGNPIIRHFLPLTCPQSERIASLLLTRIGRKIEVREGRVPLDDRELLRETSFFLQGLGEKELSSLLRGMSLTLVETELEAPTKDEKGLKKGQMDEEAEARGAEIRRADASESRIPEGDDRKPSDQNPSQQVPEAKQPEIPLLKDGLREL